MTDEPYNDEELEAPDGPFVICIVEHMCDDGCCQRFKPLTGFDYFEDADDFSEITASMTNALMVRFRVFNERMKRECTDVQELIDDGYNLCAEFDGLLASLHPDLPHVFSFFDHFGIIDFHFEIFQEEDFREMVGLENDEPLFGDEDD